MIATANLTFPRLASAEVYIVPQGYDLTGGADFLYTLRAAGGGELHRSEEAVSVVNLVLTEPIAWPDGSVTPTGQEVTALRLAPDLAALALGDPAHRKSVRYRWGLFVSGPSGEWSVQGWWTVQPDTGPATASRGPVAVSCGVQQVAVQVSGVAGGGGSGASYLELEFSAADFASGEPLRIGSLLDGRLVRDAFVRFEEDFDSLLALEVGQEGNKHKVYDQGYGATDGLLTMIYQKYAGDVYLYPVYNHAPAMGAGVIFLMSENVMPKIMNLIVPTATETISVDIVDLAGASTAVIPAGARIHHVWYEPAVVGDDGNMAITIDGSGTDLVIGTFPEADLAELDIMMFQDGWTVGSTQAGVLTATATGTPTQGSGKLYAVYSRSVLV
jgi:hypothetical protein